MRRLATILLVLVLMGAFGFGVNRFLASRKHQIQNATTPTSTKPQFALPGTMYLAQQGVLYRLQKGTFTKLDLPATGQWMQPALVPGTGELLAVVRAAAYSDVYLLNGNGTIVRQLSHNATSSSTIQLNHWMFWPHVSADGNTVWVSYDAPKSPQSYEIEFAIWTGTLTGQLATTQWTSPNGYTGGDVQAVPLPGGGLLYSKYEIGNEQVYSQLALQASAQSNPVLLTQPADDCNQPALSPDGVNVAMICTGGTGLQSTRLEVAPLVNGALGAPRVLIDKCLCSAPVWAPDGSGLVYYNATDATGHFQLWWLKNAAGVTPATPRQVTQNLDFDATSPPAWSS